MTGTTMFALLVVQGVAAARLAPIPEPATPAVVERSIDSDMPGIAHVEIQVEDVARAERLYNALFGWTFVRWDGPLEYSSAETGPADRRITVGLMRRTEPASPPVFTVYVSSIGQVLEQIEELGGAVAGPPSAVPGVGWQAYLTDSEGNPFAIFQLDPNAR